MKTIKKLFNEYLKTVGKSKLIFIILVSFIVSLLTILEPLFFAKLIKELEVFIKTGVFNSKSFTFLLIIWIIFTILYISLSYFYRYYLVDLPSLKNHNRVFIEKIGTILKMNYSEFLGKKSGSIYKNFDRGTGVQFTFPFFVLKDLIRSIFNFTLIFFVLFYIDWKMALISLSLVPVMVFFGVYYNKKTIKKQKESNEKRDSIFGAMGDAMNNFLLTKTLHLENKIENQLIEEVNEQYTRQAFVSKGRSILDIYTVSLINISRILVLSAGTYFILQGDLAFYELFLFYSYLGYIFFPLSFLFGSFERIQKEVTHGQRFYEEFENIEIEKLDEGNDLTHFSGNIEFKDVEFGYSSNKKILKKLSFDINSGETIAFVGNTGAGKSTIINLILRMWDIDKGKILLDNKDIKTLSKSSLRSHIGIVTQDNSLFNDTLKNNLLHAKPDASDEEIKQALDNAQAYFVKDMPDGIDTVIGERGMKLSGGEKQRISIARLFLKNPEILILDEATSALDNKTELLVQKALDKLMQGKTSIVIAHRLSTIQNADKIFMLENGIIIESGSYTELIKKGGKFAQLASPDNLVIG